MSFTAGKGTAKVAETLRQSKNETELKRNEKIVQDARAFVRKIKQDPSESKALKIVLATVILCFFVLCSLGLFK